MRRLLIREGAVRKALQRNTVGILALDLGVPGWLLTGLIITLSDVHIWDDDFLIELLIDD